jgi:nucleotidyltransferase/DNA polymerase involved in DNA repair
MYAIVRRYTDFVEEYSIDECFADVTEAARKGGGGVAGVEAVARAIQDDLHRLLGVSFSVGVGVNKVTAKIASKWRKPRGLTLMPREAIDGFLAELPIGKVWGIGSATTVKLRKLGVATALDLYRKDRAWVAEHCDKPLAEIYEEFHGAYVKELESTGRDPASVQRTRTFHPAVGANAAGQAFLWSQISYHVEDACARLRGQDLVARRVGFFLKTQEFQYLRGEALLPDPSAAPEEVLRAVEPEFERMWRKVVKSSGAAGEGHLPEQVTMTNHSATAEDNRFGRVGSPHAVLFRAAGVSLGGLMAVDFGSNQLFGISVRTKASRAIHATLDRLARKFGKHSVFLGSSFAAMKYGGDFDEPTGTDRAWDVIYLGEVR